MPNNSSLAGLEVTEKFVVVLVGFQVATVSQRNATCFRLALSCFELSRGLTIFRARSRSCKNECCRFSQSFKSKKGNGLNVFHALHGGHFFS